MQTAEVAVPVRTGWTAAAQVASVELNAQLAKWHPRKFSDVILAILQGNLMTPISQVANIAGTVPSPNAAIVRAPRQASACRVAITSTA